MARLIVGAILGAVLATAFRAARGNLDARRRAPDELDALTRAELYERARAAGISGRSEMTKEQLIDAIRLRDSET